jgi:hypothetical protein
MCGISREKNRKLKEKKKKLKEVEVKMNSPKTNEISLTDPEARQINTRHCVDV